MNQPNTDEQEPLSIGRGQILHTLVLGRGHAIAGGKNSTRPLVIMSEI